MARILIICLAICLSACQKPTPKASHQIKVATSDDPQTLDPRQARDLVTINILNSLYEGLMRADAQGNPQPAVAESVDITPDLKTYTFHLRKAQWSNGDPITASDFESSWKSSLDPAKPSPNAYQLYPIKGAKDAHAGKIPFSDMGVKAADPSTLVVELESPTPYFLSLVTTYFYFPVHTPQETSFVGNGPFKLDSWSRHNEIVLTKNPMYWDEQAVKLNKIAFVIADDHTALQLFENGEIDWTGSPSSTLPTDALAALRAKGLLATTSGAGTHFVRINTSQVPFDTTENRRLFRDALNRTDLVEHVLQGNQKPALGIVPPSFATSTPFFADNTEDKKNIIEASKFPTITLCYGAGERNSKVAQVLQQQWKKVLGVDVQLQTCESKVLFDKLKKRDYQVALGAWYADYRDPISFLDLFKERNNGTNNTEWENDRFKELLAFSAEEADFTQRTQLLKDAEKVLINEAPIIPLFYATYNYAHDPALKGFYFSELGYLDFKNADINRP